MNANKKNYIIPVMLAFFTMGFVDLIGIATNYVKQDFGLSDVAANSFSVMVFLWFLVFSVPTGVLMNKIGRKRTVLLSMIITFLGLIIPLFSYTKITMFLAFSFLGIGNTLMQVSLNPLLASMVRKDRLPSYLTLGQFIKAIASFIAPLIAVKAALYCNNWKLLFAIFAGIDIIAIVYLFITDITETEKGKNASSFIGCMRLLGDTTILLFFIGILVHVGIDVGINITAPKLLQERVGISLAEAGYITSLYFLFRTLGCLSGTFIMARFSSVSFFTVSVIMIFGGILGVYVSENTLAIYLCVALIGFGNSNVFSIIFSKALLYLPSQYNEISGLMIMGLVGGGIFPLLMGTLSDTMGGQIGAIIILTLCAFYLLYLTIWMNKKMCK